MKFLIKLDIPHETSSLLDIHVVFLNYTFVGHCHPQLDNLGHPQEQVATQCELQ